MDSENVLALERERVFVAVVIIFSYYRYAGILSAYGLALADVVNETQEPCALMYQGNIN